MSIVAAKHSHVIGVDTHAKTHPYAVLDSATGRASDTATFPTSPAGLDRAITWIRRRGAATPLVAIEGTGSYGANFTRRLQAEDINVCEVRPPKRGDRASKGKSDDIDAIAAARTALASDPSRLATPRADGIRSALRVLLVARQAMDARRTADRNILNALLRSFDLGIDARRAITDAQLTAISRWYHRSTDEPAISTIRDEARRLAISVIDFTRQIENNQQALARHVDELAPGLLDIYCVGPITGAIVLTAYSHKGRVRSEAAFAALAGASPLPASSGNTTRHRLNRNGDRKLNKALDVTA